MGRVGDQPGGGGSELALAVGGGAGSVERQERWDACAGSAGEEKRG